MRSHFKDGSTKNKKIPIGKIWENNPPSLQCLLVMVAIKNKNSL